MGPDRVPANGDKPVEGKEPLQPSQLSALEPEPLAVGRYVEWKPGYQSQECQHFCYCFVHPMLNSLFPLKVQKCC